METALLGGAGRPSGPAGCLDLEGARQSLGELLTLHQAGDYGVVDQEQMVRNHEACDVGNDVISLYVLPHTGEKLWIVTADIRWFTGVFLASETC